METEQSSYEELLLNYQAGSVEAFTEFYNRISPVLMRLALKKTGDNEVSEEIVQESFFRVHKYILKYKAGNSAFNWVYTITANVIASFYKKGKIETVELTEEELLQSFVEPVFHLEEVEEFNSHLRLLSDADKGLLYARVVDELSYATIGEQFNLSQANARKKISRIINILKENASNASQNYPSSK